MSDAEKQLGQLLALLAEPAACGEELASLTSHLFPTIPETVLNVMLVAEQYREGFQFAFLGYDALTQAEVEESYREASGNRHFFGTYGCQSGYKLVDDMQIALEDTLAGELDDPALIEDISTLMPLFNFQGDYLVVDLGEKNYGALLNVVDGHIGSYLAPGIVEHIRDLRDGMAEGSYRVIDGALVYPTAWHQRVGLREGRLRMDDYGDICS